MNNIFKLYGLDHSGSHYLSFLMINNFPNVVMLHSQTGWNHGPIVKTLDWNGTNWNLDRHEHPNEKQHIKDLKREPLNSGKTVDFYKKEIEDLYKTRKLPLLCLVKSPWNWLMSFNIKHSKKYKKIEDSCKKWNDINENYFSNEWENKIMIKYETLRDDTLVTLNRVGSHFNFPKLESFIDTDGDLAKGGQFKKVDYTKEQCISAHVTHFKKDKEEICEIFDKFITKKVLDNYNKLI